AGATSASRVWLFIAIASAAGLLTMMPWRALDKYHHYRGTSGEMRRLARENNLGRSLVIVRGRLWPDYAEASPLNPAEITADYDGTVFAREVDERTTQALREAFPNRAVWFVEGNSVTQPRFRLLKSPAPE
ncbi:MAG: hypothetical protein ACREUU_08760, partial [Gammaproteobacteria bacterium]